MSKARRQLQTGTLNREFRPAVLNRIEIYEAVEGGIPTINVRGACRSPADAVRMLRAALEKAESDMRKTTVISLPSNVPADIAATIQAKTQTPKKSQTRRNRADGFSRRPK